MSALLDIRIFRQDDVVIASYHTHDDRYWPEPSGSGEGEHESLDAALEWVQMRFGLSDYDWTLRTEDGDLTSGQVEAIVDDSLKPYRVDEAALLRTVELTPVPQRLAITNPGYPAVPGWLVARSGQYDIFYDSADGSFGLATGDEGQDFAYVSNTGPLIRTLRVL